MTIIAVRVPYTTRENTSVPPTVVPNQCADDGACCAPNTTPSLVRSASKP